MGGNSAEARLRLLGPEWPLGVSSGQSGLHGRRAAMTATPTGSASFRQCETLAGVSVVIVKARMRRMRQLVVAANGKSTKDNGTDLVDVLGGKG